MSKIDMLVSNFVSALRKAIATDAAAAFARVAGGGAPAGVTRGRAKRRKASAPRARAKGAKRSPETIEAQTKALLGAIKKAPGSSIEELASTLKISTKDLALPVLKLWDAKSIRSTGQKRGTKYFPK